MMATSATSRQNRRLDSSVSFSRSRGPSQQTEDEDDDDVIQISLAAYIQSDLAQSSQRLGCCGVCLPIPFERAARQSWWDPRFDSEILEGQYKRSSFPQVRLRFQYALLYVIVVSLSWLIYFIATGLSGMTHNWMAIAGTFAALLLAVVSLFVLTYTQLYRRYTLPVSLCIAITMALLSILFVILDSSNNRSPDITPVGQFSLCIEILLIMYTVIPLPLYVCVIIGGVYSIVFESLTAMLNYSDVNGVKDGYGVVVRALLQLCVHFIGIHILIMTNVRMRGTFMKVGQSLLVRRQLEMEKQLKEKMILSVMPPKVANWLMLETGGGREEDHRGFSTHIGSTQHRAGGDIRSLFRPFNMHRMENVSILFADIVGFTRMSSNKSAEELVGILNDLFERFDDLCATNGCEKISTLGDCYYCVAGCPEPKPDHAKACVEMGLGMIEAIKQFDAETNEGVNMRVGVHTGTVLCGIVGTRRFKFDVWSNDVTLANQMESTGRPGQVHISETTRSFLEDSYWLEEGQLVNGIMTYFIRGRKSDPFSMDPVTVLVQPPSTPPVSPLSPPRARVQSCGPTAVIGGGPVKRPHYLQLVTGSMKACSLPSILDSDNDDDSETREGGDSGGGKSPTSLVSCGKFSPRAKTWRYHGNKFKRRTDETEPLDLEGIRHSSPPSRRSVGPEEPENNGYQQLDANGSDRLQAETTLVQLDLPGVPGHEDRLSMCPSINSRKDSGIRSNSRRSSIQQQIFVMNGIAHGELLAHRVSGYCTSSQSSLNECDADVEGRRSHLPPPLGDNIGVCFHKLRKQSDLQLIRCVQDVISHRSYFVKPPLSGLSLFFRQKEMEKEYRAHAHRVTEKKSDSPTTLATSRYNTYFDILISAMIFIAVAISLYLLFIPSVLWIIVSVLASGIQTFAVILCIRQLLQVRYRTWSRRNLSRRILAMFSSWYPWHIVGAVLVSLPIISVLVNFSCDNFQTASDADFYYSYLLFVGLVHFCNFTQLNCWMKSILATVAGILYISLVTSHAYPFPVMNNSSLPSSPGEDGSADSFNNPNVFLNHSHHFGTSTSLSFPMNKQTDITNSSTKYCMMGHVYRSTNLYRAEIFIDVLLLLILVWFLNREFEISYRLSFHGNIVAARDKAKVQSMKNQADWLLHNIIPKHVADQLKNTAKYSENHHNVGIIFASIVNFNEMYDESYLGGKEYLRVLNELIGDFDELLTKPEFKNVEKIKTIGSTFMAASGLNPEIRRSNKHPNQHLFELMDFAMAMQKVIDDFNRDLLEFNLILRVGYNFGDVTAGVIGTTKLYYDIWGDAVNIASRMDSTGVPGRIQVAGTCVPVLSERYEFEPRGSVYVKGKDNMNVFLLKGIREDNVIIDDG
ncbi:adenylate cyclase type 9 [Anabrus simplex]|uniref:adenylate cyclase type 9 n=1 Tax=Anabrus simplex TaxID=316456 RepID=UPI0035A320DE